MLRPGGFLLHAGLAGILATGSAHAQPVPPGQEGELARFVPPEPGRRACYERVYDAAHLAAHPKQRVTAIGFRIAYHRHPPARDLPPEGQRNYYFQLEVRMKGEAKRLTGTGECRPERGAIACAIECDGGGIAVRRLDEENRIEIGFTEGKRIRMSRSCDDESDTRDLTPGADDHRFHLTRVKACPPHSAW